MSRSIRRVLIVESDADGRTELRHMLRNGSNQRYEFAEADSGSTALAQFQSSATESFDCLVLQCDLPDMDAIEVLAALRGENEVPPCAVVVITGSGRISSKGLILSGAQDVLGRNWLTAESLTSAVDTAICRYAMLIDKNQKGLAVYKSAAMFRSLLESAPDAIVIVDQHEDIVLVNKKAEEMFGYSREEMLGEAVDLLMPGRLRQAHTEYRAD